MPPTSPDDFKQFMERARAGCRDAARDIVEKHDLHMRIVVRAHLDRRVRLRQDSGDILQDVWLAFFSKVLHTAPLETPEHLAGYLCGMARLKALETNRYNLDRQKNDLRKQRSLDAADSSGGRALVAPGPTPPQAVARREEVERLIAARPPVQRTLLRLLLQGLTQEQIAQRIGSDERTVRRMMDNIRCKLKAEAAPESLTRLLDEPPGREAAALVM